MIPANRYNILSAKAAAAALPIKPRVLRDRETHRERPEFADEYLILGSKK